MESREPPPDEDRGRMFPADSEKPFLDHLEELRRVLIISIVATVLGAIAAWWFAPFIMDVLTSDVGTLNFARITEAFTTRLKVALTLGFLVVLPVVLYLVWRFVTPGLFPHERRIVLPLVAGSTILFYAGMTFAFFGIKPLAVKFLLGYTVPGKLEPVIMVGDYFGFVAKICVAFGLVFQLPLVICFLSWVGVIDPDKLGRGWRYAVVIAFVGGALLTPPDPLTQLAMAIPLLTLFLGSVLLSRLLVRRGKRRRRAERPPPADTG